MSNSNHLPSFTFDVLCYLNRNQLERFVIVSRPLKNLIERYFHSKPYRFFERLHIWGGTYALQHNFVRWHPNRDDYSVQQFLARQKCSIDESKRAWNDNTYYSFAEMRPFLAPTVRIKMVCLFVADCTYNPEHIAEMESIAYLWRDGTIVISNNKNNNSLLLAGDFQPILNSRTVLQCKRLSIHNPRFSFKDYKIFYTLNVIRITYGDEHNYWPEFLDYWPEFLEQPGVKPVVVLRLLHRETINGVLDRLSKAFLSAVLPNPFKLVFGSGHNDGTLIEFRETNKSSGENLELKKVDRFSYSLERYSI